MAQHPREEHPGEGIRGDRQIHVPPHQPGFARGLEIRDEARALRPGRIQDDLLRLVGIPPRLPDHRADQRLLLREQGIVTFRVAPQMRLQIPRPLPRIPHGLRILLPAHDGLHDLGEQPLLVLKKPEERDLVHPGLAGDGPRRRAVQTARTPPDRGRETPLARKAHRGYSRGPFSYEHDHSIHSRNHRRRAPE